MNKLALIMLLLFPLQLSTVTSIDSINTKLFNLGFQPKKEVDCLAHNIYHEARGESIKGQIAVAAVTINRLLSQGYPTSICQVVYQPNQFSWVKLLKNHSPKDRKRYELAHAIASNYVQGKLKDPTNGSIFYHAHYVLPKWASKVTKTVTIGNHVFYA
jgi:spore germination cell wall hydrolase CwlJ-like protein